MALTFGAWTEADGDVMNQHDDVLTNEKCICHYRDHNKEAFIQTQMSAKSTRACLSIRLGLHRCLKCVRELDKLHMPQPCVLVILVPDRAFLSPVEPSRIKEDT